MPASPPISGPHADPGFGGGRTHVAESQSCRGGHFALETFHGKCSGLAPAGSVVLCLVTGCGGGADLPVPVRGTVTLDGQAVEAAAISFIPESGTARPASGETRADGTYEITTRNSGDGAMRGDYRVIVVWEPPPPPMFRTGETGPSRVEMQKAITDYQARQKKAGAGPSIPAIYSDQGKSPLKVTVPAPNGKADFALSSKQ